MSKNISVNIEIYNNIITRYKNGEFGDKPLSLFEILKKSNEENLINEMNISEIQYLIDNSSGLLKMLFLEAKKKKMEAEQKYQSHSILKKVRY